MLVPVVTVLVVVDVVADVVVISAHASYPFGHVSAEPSSYDRHTLAPLTHGPAPNAHCSAEHKASGATVARVVVVVVTRQS